MTLADTYAAGAAPPLGCGDRNRIVASTAVDEGAAAMRSEMSHPQVSKWGFRIPRALSGAPAGSGALTSISVAKHSR